MTLPPPLAENLAQILNELMKIQNNQMKSCTKCPQDIELSTFFPIGLSYSQINNEYNIYLTVSLSIQFAAESHIK